LGVFKKINGISREDESAARCPCAGAEFYYVIGVSDDIVIMLYYYDGIAP
jgi:hypothetical protein